MMDETRMDEIGPDSAMMEDKLAQPPFEILAPAEHRAPIVFNSPHSGRCYPETFIQRSRLDPVTIRRSEDMMVDELFRPVLDCGAPLLRAVYPRAYLDVNREPFELDPKMFSGQLPPFANSQSLRVAGGLGTIPKVVCDAAAIYPAPWPVDYALRRIDAIYRPYHDALRRLLAETHVVFGSAILIDCHSMPSTLRNGEGSLRPDFVLGDRFGTSCMPALVERTTTSLRALGYTVCRNKPYAGGFITEHYGRPRRALHALQIEVNRALYMDEEKLELHSGFAELQKNLATLAETMIDLAAEFAADMRDAAE
jgi:N-formylglutamate amidohydrolase